MNVLHVAPAVGESSFGIGTVVRNLVKYQQTIGDRAYIWSLDSENEAIELERIYHLVQGTIRTWRIRGPNRLGYSPTMVSAIKKYSKAYQVVHQHGVWTAVSHATTQWKKQTNGATVIAPHGSLDAWALKRSWWKKRIALTIYEQKNLREASCLHALSDMEAKEFRQFGLRNPIAVIPNGINSSWLLNDGDTRIFRQQFEIPEGQKICLFLGRITPKKGLLLFIQVMAKMKKKLKDWILVIAGVDEFQHQREVELLINRLDMKEYVQFVGPLFGKIKRDAFAAADLFVLPSYSEGAPMTILEALGAGTPVLTTKASPWQDLVTYNCGWWTDISEDDIADALADAVSKSELELQSMGSRGKALVSNKYSWEQIAAQTVSLYKWLLGEADKPDFVLKD